MPDLEKVIRELETLVEWHTDYGVQFTYEEIDTIHNAIDLLRDQKPAVANWQDQTDLDDIYLSWRCSRCGHYSPTETRYTYCPYCGAKMEVKQDGTDRRALV